MNLDLARRRHTGAAPFEEAWFIEGSLDGERAFWLRYTLSHDGPTPHCAVWGAIVEGDAVVAARVAEPLAGQPSDVLLTTAAGQLTPAHATGRVGELEWDLSLSASRSHDHLPRRLAALGLSGRHYASPGLDLRLSGSLAVGETTLVLHDSPAVLGHIWGARANTRAWAWAHCDAFDTRLDLTFEALSARLTVGGIPLPWATSAVVHVGPHRLGFTRTRGLFQARSRVSTQTWDLTLRDGQTQVHASMRMPDPSRRVRVAVEHADGRTTRVHNSPLAALELSVSDPTVGRFRDRSRRCSLELAQAGETQDPHLRG